MDTALSFSRDIALTSFGRSGLLIRGCDLDDLVEEEEKSCCCAWPHGWSGLLGKTLFSLKPEVFDSIDKQLLESFHFTVLPTSVDTQQQKFTCWTLTMVFSVDLSKFCQATARKFATETFIEGQQNSGLIGGVRGGTCDEKEPTAMASPPTRPHRRSREQY